MLDQARFFGRQGLFVGAERSSRVRAFIKSKGEFAHGLLLELLFDPGPPPQTSPRPLRERIVVTVAFASRNTREIFRKLAFPTQLSEARSMFRIHVTSRPWALARPYAPVLAANLFPDKIPVAQTGGIMVLIDS